MMLKEGGSLVIDTIGNLPIDEDIDLLPDPVSINVNYELMLWADSGHSLQYMTDADHMLLLGV